MPKKPSVADQFSDDDMHKIKHYGQMLGGGVTPFDEAVEEALNKREEASAKKMHAAQTGGSTQGLGPSEMDQAAIKQRGAIEQQSGAAGAVKAAQAQGEEGPIEAPSAPTGPQGATIPFTAQKGAVGGSGNPLQASAPPAAPPAAPGEETGEEEPPV